MDRAAGKAGVEEMQADLCFYDPMVQQLATALMQEVDGGTRHGTLYAESLATALVLVLLRPQGSSSETPHRRSPRLSVGAMQELCDFIEEHLTSELHLDDLAERVGLSLGTFSKAFRLALGSTPYQYYLTRRIARAKEMLRLTRIPLTEMALQLGFSDHSHFASTFRRRVGMTPSSFRAMVRR